MYHHLVGEVDVSIMDALVAESGSICPPQRDTSLLRVQKKIV